MVRARAAAGATRWCSPPRCTARWATGPNESRLSKLAIRKACEASLRAAAHRPHRPLPDAPHRPDAWWDEIWEAMEQLKREGKILYVGSSNFAGWHIARGNEIAGYRHSLGLATEQSLYNLTARTVELEVVPAVEEYGMGLIPYSPLAGGLLAGALKKVDRGPAQRGVHARRDRGQPRPARDRGRRSAPSSANAPPTSRSLGSCTSRRSPRPSSAHAPRSSCWGRCAR